MTTLEIPTTWTAAMLPEEGTPVEVRTTEGETYRGRVLAAVAYDGGEQLVIQDGAGRWNIETSDISGVRITGSVRPFRARTNNWKRPARLAFGA